MAFTSAEISITEDVGSTLPYGVFALEATSAPLAEPALGNRATPSCALVGNRLVRVHAALTGAPTTSSVAGRHPLTAQLLQQLRQAEALTSLKVAPSRSESALTSPVIPANAGLRLGRDRGQDAL